MIELQQVIASGQVSAEQIEAHRVAGELPAPCNHFWAGRVDEFGVWCHNCGITQSALVAESKPATLREAIAGATDENMHVWCKVSDVRAALEDARRLRKALTALVRHSNSIEVLGEWSATDSNISSGIKLRKEVDACIREAVAAIKATS